MPLNTRGSRKTTGGQTGVLLIKTSN